MRYGILTAFADISSQYSLTGIVVDQARMIHNAGHTPVFFALNCFNVEKHRSLFPPSTEFRTVLPDFKAVDYQSAADLSAEHIALIISSKSKPGSFIR